MNALQFVRWYFKHVWNIVRDEPPGNATVEPCHCNKKHWGVPCKGWMFKDKTPQQLKKERKMVVVPDLAYEPGVGAVQKEGKAPKLSKHDRREERRDKQRKRHG